MQVPVAPEVRADSTDPAPVLSITPAAAPPAKRRTLTEAVVDAIRLRHYSRKTEQAYVHWIRCFVLWSGKRHPRDMGGTEVGEFLTSLAVNDQVSEPTQRQALSALLFLYRQVLEVDLPWMVNVVRAKPSQHLPEVLSRDEVRHTYASAQLTAGANPWWVAQQLGHVDVEMVFRTYGKFIPADYTKPKATRLRVVAATNSKDST